MLAEFGNIGQSPFVLRGILHLRKASMTKGYDAFSSIPYIYIYIHTYIHTYPRRFKAP